MAEFGWTVPCLVADDGELIAGHGRVLAATQLGLTEAPVIVLGHLTEAQRRAYPSECYQRSTAAHALAAYVTKLALVRLWCGQVIDLDDQKWGCCLRPGLA